MVPQGSEAGRLVSGWVPPNLQLTLILEREGERWTAVVREFSVAGQGDTPHQAAAEAVDLLVDYFVVCASRGMAFEQATRPMPTKEQAGFFVRLLSDLARHRGRRGGRRAEEVWRAPFETLRTLRSCP